MFTTKVIIYIHIEPYHEKENIKFDMSAKFEDLWINMVRIRAFENLTNYRTMKYMYMYSEVRNTVLRDGSPLFRCVS